MSIRAVFAAVMVAVAGAAHGQGVNLKFASFEPPNAALTSRVFVPWAEGVTKTAGGALKVEVFAGGVLGRNPVMQLKMVQDGVADIAWTVAAYTPGRFDDTDVVALPFLTRNSAEATLALWRLHSRNAFAGFEDFKLLAISATPPVVIHSRVPVKTLADLKGKRVRASGAHLLKVIESLGATPVQIGATQIAESLARGVVDISLNNWGFVGDFKVDEVTAYHLNMPMGAVCVIVPMLKSRFEALPAAAKAAIEASSGEAFSLKIAAMFDELETRYAERIAKSGRNSVLAPSPAEIAVWEKAVEPVNDAWRRAAPRNEQLYQAFAAELAKVRTGK